MKKQAFKIYNVRGLNTGTNYCLVKQLFDNYDKGRPESAQELKMMFQYLIFREVLQIIAEFAGRYLDASCLDCNNGECIH